MWEATPRKPSKGQAVLPIKCQGQLAPTPRPPLLLLSLSLHCVAFTGLALLTYCGSLSYCFAQQYGNPWRKPVRKGDAVTLGALEEYSCLAEHTYLGGSVHILGFTEAPQTTT